MPEENDAFTSLLEKMIKDIHVVDRQVPEQKDKIDKIVSCFFEDVDNLADPYYTDETIRTLCETQQSLRAITLSKNVNSPERALLDNVFLKFSESLRDKGLGYDFERERVLPASPELLVTSATPCEDLERITLWLLQKRHPQHLGQLANTFSGEVIFFMHDFNKIQLTRVYKDFLDTESGERLTVRRAQALSSAAAQIGEFEKVVDNFANNITKVENALEARMQSVK
jgi:hypothetical protein